ncbi:MAG: hypothetical protein BGN88_05415 [Clostridiales bacterium 43-6]|nr:MAG: hypothetical protein BGN88_05415 [Clostridiales bacterium 43-6]
MKNIIEILKNNKTIAYIKANIVLVTALLTGIITLLGFLMQLAIYIFSKGFGDYFSIDSFYYKATNQNLLLDLFFYGTLSLLLYVFLNFSKYMFVLAFRKKLFPCNKFFNLVLIAIISAAILSFINYVYYILPNKNILIYSDNIYFLTIYLSILYLFDLFIILATPQFIFRRHKHIDEESVNQENIKETRLRNYAIYILFYFAFMTIILPYAWGMFIAMNDKTYDITEDKTQVIIHRFDDKCLLVKSAYDEKSGTLVIYKNEKKVVPILDLAYENIKAKKVDLEP